MPTHDPHAMRLAWTLEHVIARVVPAAEDVIADQLALIDGHPGGDSGEPHVTTTTSSSTTERAALRRAQLSGDAFQVRDDLATIQTLVNSLGRMCDRIIRRSPAERDGDDPVVPLCCEGQRGKEGNIEWGDVTCVMPAVKAGMCGAHYLSWWRHRKAHGIDTSRDHAAA